MAEQAKTPDSQVTGPTDPEMLDSHPFGSTKHLDALFEVMGRHEASELELELPQGRVWLRRGSLPQPAALAPMPAPMPSPKLDREAASPLSEEGLSFITSPLVGTFYRAPSPDAPAFVDVGSTIKPGSRLCIVEAMKLMNEIESEVQGTIVEILVENGKAVEYGQRLFRVKP